MKIKASGWLITVERCYVNTAKGKDWETVFALISRKWGKTLKEALRNAEGVIEEEAEERS